MNVPEKYAILRTYENHSFVNRLINKRYDTTYVYDDRYLCVDTTHKGYPGDCVNTRESVPLGYTLVSLEQFQQIFLDEDAKEKRKAQQAIEDKIKKDIKGLYRERLKTLEDTIVELRYENQQLKQQLARTSPVSC